MNIKISYNNKLKVAVLAILCIVTTSVVAQKTFTPWEGMSGRPLTTVKMLNETGSGYEDVQMQSTHEWRQTVYIKDDETKNITLQTWRIGGYYRWFRYDKHIDMNSIYFLNKNKIVLSNTDTINYGKDGVVLIGKNQPNTAALKSPGAEFNNMTIACDISNQKDTAGKCEPTLLYRMIYDIRPASIMAEKLDKCVKSASGDTTFLETYSMTAPRYREKTTVPTRTTELNTLIIGPKYPYCKMLCDGHYAPTVYSNYYYTKAGVITATDSAKSDNRGEGKFYWIEKRHPEIKYYHLQNGRSFTVTAPDSVDQQEWMLTDGIHYIAKFVINYVELKTTGPIVGGLPGCSDEELAKKYKVIVERRFDGDPANPPYWDSSKGWINPILYRVR